MWNFILSNIPGYVEDINYIKNNEDWDNAEKYDKDKKW